ncbi:MAG: E2/UBC family protein [Actinomycetes bacterium]
MLTPADLNVLESLGLAWSSQDEGGWTCLVISDWPLPPGYQQTSADLLLRLSPGYPDVPLDMWWFEPVVSRSDNQPIAQTDVREQVLGRVWQRWSRHLNPGDWRPGVDGVQSFLARVRGELRASAGPVLTP